MAGRKDFWVDWSDQAFPSIHLGSEADPQQELITITEAKQVIIEHFQAQIQHARMMIRETRAVRGDEIESQGDS